MSTEDNQQLKKEFERYIQNARKCLSTAFDLEKGIYTDAETERLWQVYLATNGD